MAENLIPITLEAESMTLINYRREAQSIASGGSIISFVSGTSNETGKASKAFSGSSTLKIL